MRKKDKVALVCLSLLIGGSLALFVPLFLIIRKIFSDWLWAFVAPAWVLLDPGAHDGPIMLLAVILDAFIFGSIVYGAIYAIVRFLTRATY